MIAFLKKIQIYKTASSKKFGKDIFKLNKFAINNVLVKICRRKNIL